MGGGNAKHTDQGTEFLSSVTDEMAKLAGITLTSTKGYNFKENSICERAGGDVCFSSWCH